MSVALAAVATWRALCGWPTRPELRWTRLTIASERWFQHAEFIHAHDGPCLFSGCGCPYFTSAEPGVVVLR
jgi:hypothetical protein